MIIASNTLFHSAFAIACLGIKNEHNFHIFFLIFVLIYKNTCHKKIFKIDEIFY